MNAFGPSLGQKLGAREHWNKELHVLGRQCRNSSYFIHDSLKSRPFLFLACLRGFLPSVSFLARAVVWSVWLGSIVCCYVLELSKTVHEQTPQTPATQSHSFIVLDYRATSKKKNNTTDLILSDCTVYVRFLFFNCPLIRRVFSVTMV